MALNITKLKCLLYCSNLIFVVLGITILVFGVMYLGAHAEFSVLVTDNYIYLPHILIVLGSLTFIIAFCGCCGALRQNNCLMGTFAALVLTVLLGEIVLVVGVYVYYSDVMEVIEKKMNETFPKFKLEDPKLQKTWDLLHFHLQCCAVHGPADFEGFRPVLSCCREYMLRKDVVCSEGELWEEGCLQRVEDLVTKHTIIMYVVGSLLMATELFLVGVGCFMAEIYRTQQS